MDQIEDETDLQEQIFHNNVREQIIFLLLFILLYLSSFALLGRFKRKGREDYYSTDEDEVMVYRISTWLCTFSLAVSLGAVLLLPFSIISNEVLLLYPKSYYVKWLNGSLVQGLWNHIFLFSNLSLFVLLPFAYLFTESEGFFGHRKGLMARVQETFVVLALLAMAVLGMTYVISAVIDKDKSSIQTLLNLWSYHLPFLYSCISFLGVLMLLVCTPLGFVRLFDVVGQYLIKPQFLRDIDEEYHAYAMEEECLRRRLKHAQTTGKSYMTPAPMSLEQTRPILQDEYDTPNSLLRLRNGQLQSALGLRLTEIEMKRRVLDKQRQTSSLRRNVLYPVAMVLLFLLTGITVFMVLQNTVELLIGIKALPLSSRQFTLGVSSLSKLGPFGAFLEIVLILYLIATSAIGLYSSPPMSRIRPRTKSTPFNLVIGNCALILILSSALPLLSKILGITNFDLLGDFGSIEWLGNFQIVFMYNLVFATAATLCIANNFTAKVRRELYARMTSFVIAGKPDCPAFVHAVHVARYLEETLPHFSINIIQRKTGIWEPWLQDQNHKYNWHHPHSPLIWKEISMRGGIPYYVGGLSEFWEYCYDYYGLESIMSPEDLQNLVADNMQYFEELEKKEEEKQKNIRQVGITGAMCPVLKLLLPELLQIPDLQKSSGILINLYDVDADVVGETDYFFEIIEGVSELATNGEIDTVVWVDRMEDLLKDCELLIVLGDATRQADEPLIDWLTKEMSNMFMLADEINAFAKRNLRVIVALSGAVCFCATILIETCTTIRVQNIVAVTSDVGLGYLNFTAEQVNVPVEKLGAPPVWGFVDINEFVDVESSVMYSDVYRPYQRVLRNKGGSTLPLGTVQPELRFIAYLIKDLKDIHRKTENARNVINAQLCRPPMYAKVRAVVSLLKLWYAKEPPDDIISLGISSIGSFDLPIRIVFSQPVMLEKSVWVPFKNFPVTEKSKREIENLIPSIVELIERFNIGPNAACSAISI